MGPNVQPCSVCGPALKTAYVTSNGGTNISDRDVLEHHGLLHPALDPVLAAAGGRVTTATPLHRQESDDDMIVTNNVYDPDALPVVGTEQDLVLSTEDLFHGMPRRVYL